MSSSANIADDELSSARVIRVLREMVVTNLRPGDKLPGETELAARFGVSRLTIREAMKALSGRGLIAVRRGARPTVIAQDSSLLSDYFEIELRRDPRGLLELLDIRRSLEALSVGDAAAAATPAAIAALTAPIERMAAAVEQLRHGEDVGEAFHQADLDFHAALSLISGNRMLARLIDGLTQSLHDSFLVSARGHALRGHGPEGVVAAHRAIAEAVAAGDRVRARAAMARHLDETERDLLAVLSASKDSSEGTDRQ